MNNDAIDINDKKSILKSFLLQNINQQPSKAKMQIVFILCAPRTGSTLLRLMLSANGELFSPPELQLLKYNDLQEYRKNEIQYNKIHGGITRSFRELYGLSIEEATLYLDKLIEENKSIKDIYNLIFDKLNSRILIDKSPAYSKELSIIRKAENIFHKPKYIFLTRHPYTTIDSIVNSRIFTYTKENELDPYQYAEQIWYERNHNIITFLNTIEKDRYYHIKYEDLVTDSNRNLKKLCDFMQIPFDNRMEEPYKYGKMIDGTGDPNIFNHKAIESENADKWKEISLPFDLSCKSKEIASNLDYAL